MSRIESERLSPLLLSFLRILYSKSLSRGLSRYAIAAPMMSGESTEKMLEKNEKIKSERIFYYHQYSAITSHVIPVTIIASTPTMRSGIARPGKDHVSIETGIRSAAPSKPRKNGP